MNETDKVLLQHFDKLIEQGEDIRSLKEQRFFQRFLVALDMVRRESLQTILAGAQGSTRDELVGYAKCANYLVNLFETLANESTTALERKAELLEQIRYHERVDAQQQAQVRYSGHGAI